jgi:hypothetical protein
VNDISKALNEMFKIYYLYGRIKVKDGLKKEIAKYDKKEAEKITFAENKHTGKEFRPDQAINELIKELQTGEGNIYKTRLNVDLLLNKVKKIAILSYSDYVKRVNTKLLVALSDSKQPYKTFIKLLENDGIKDFALKDAVNVNGYWRTVFSTNLSTIFGAGFNDQRDELKEFIKGEEYIAIVKEHPVCKAQSGEIREIGGFAATGTEEPNGYNCTGYRKIISKVRAEAMNIKLTPKDKRTNVKPDEGFHGSNTVKKTNTLPKKTENRLPTGYIKLL